MDRSFASDLRCFQVTFLYSDKVDMRDIGLNYRRFINLALTYAPNHVSRLQEEYLLSRVNTPSSMGSDMSYGRKTGSFADVTFVIGEEAERVSAHSVVLSSNSPYFKAMFLGGLRLDRSKDIVLPDVGTSAFRQILDYIYTGEVDFETVDKEGTIVELFSLSHRFQTPKLSLVIEDILVYSLTPENTVSVLLMAEQQDAVGLRKRTIEYLRKHQDEVSSTEEYLASADIVATILSQH